MEYRAAVYPSEDPLLVRISVGLEDVEVWIAWIEAPG